MVWKNMGCVLGVAAFAMFACSSSPDQTSQLDLTPEGMSEPVKRSSSETLPGEALNPDLSLVRFPPGSSSRTIHALRLWSEVLPWVDEASGYQTWVLSVNAPLRARLEADGLEVLPFTIPPEYAGWSTDRQQAMSLVAKECLLQDGSTFSPGVRWKTTFPGAEPFGPHYGSYYLPYDATVDDDTHVPSFPDRVRTWKEFAVQTGYGPPGKRVKISDRMIRGWPAHDKAAQFDDHGLRTDDVRRPISYIDIGWPQSGKWGDRQHNGPNAVVLVTANQHPRELVTHEAAWRLAQRIVAYYALADVEDPSVPQMEGRRPRGFWRDLIDAGLHVVIVPTVNPSTYNDVALHQWPKNPTKSGEWWRTNGNFVDTNRNFPAHWLQGGSDGDETWGWGKLPDDASFAGSAPASEPETQAVLGITQYSLLELQHGDLDWRSLLRRLPVVAMDLHSAYGMVTSFTHYSNTVEIGKGPTEEAWLCGAMSDCLHADSPGMLAIFGNNERPSVVEPRAWRCLPMGQPWMIPPHLICTARPPTISMQRVVT